MPRTKVAKPAKGALIRRIKVKHSTKKVIKRNKLLKKGRRSVV